MTLKEYIKTSIANKATLIGHLGITAIAIGSVLENITNLDIHAGIYAAVAIPTAILEHETFAGFSTYREYKRAKRLIKNPDETPKKVFEAYENSAYYCNRLGAYLACKEAGMEESASQISLNPFWRR